MEAIVGVVGALVGGVLALAGQWLQSQGAESRDVRNVLLEQCAIVVGLEHDFRDRVWAYRYRDVEDALHEWPRRERRQAEARILILSGDRDLRKGLLAVRDTGRQVGHALDAEDNVFKGLAEAHWLALWEFRDAAHRVIDGTRRFRLGRRDKSADDLRDLGFADRQVWRDPGRPLN